MPLEGIPWLKYYADDPSAYALEIEEEDDALFLQELEERVIDRADGELDWDELEEMPAPEMQNLIQDGDWKQDMNSIRRALAKLGYVTGGSGPYLDEDTALAIYQFQKSQEGLKADKIPGNLTQEALYKRLQEFRLE
jgi:peptidoglycan hydrolase-like protein with peptidoglycan-binding domain